MESTFSIILTTTRNQQEAQAIATKLKINTLC